MKVGDKIRMRDSEADIDGVTVFSKGDVFEVIKLYDPSNTDEKPVVGIWGRPGKSLKSSGMPWWVEGWQYEPVSDPVINAYGGVTVAAVAAPEPACKCLPRDLLSGEHPSACPWYAWKRGQR